MKRITTVLFIASLFALVLGIGSCSDPCKGVTCQNGGTCNEGKCTCATGYSGTNCQTAANAQFVGTYNGTDNCGGGGTVSDQVTIAAQSSPLKITITVAGTGYMVTATVSGNSITIPSQNITYAVDSHSLTITGSGTLTGNSLTTTLNIVDITDPSANGDGGSCTFTGSK